MLTNDDLLIAEAAARAYPQGAGLGWSVHRSIFKFPAFTVVDGLRDGTLSFDEC